MLTFCQTRFGAGRRNSLIDHFGVSGCGNGLLCNQTFVANRTVFALG